MTRTADFRSKLFAIAALAICGLTIGHSAEAMERGELFLTQGLVCDRPSFIDAIVTLTSSGEKIEAAMAQVNAGAEEPRCMAGMLLVARYVAKARTFFVDDTAVHVHKVKVVGFGLMSSDEVIPQRLQKPMTKYVFSIAKAPGV